MNENIHSYHDREKLKKCLSEIIFRNDRTQNYAITYLKCKTNLHRRRIAAITPPITRSDIIAMMAIILVFLEVFKHFRRDLTLAKEAFETDKGTSVMLFQFLFLLSYFIFFLKNNLS